MDLITYETIRGVHRAEKDEQLQQLPIGFFEAVKNWLIHRRASKDAFSLLETENAKKLLEDIISRREKKIVLSAMRTIRGELPPKHLTDSEQKFFDEIVNSLKIYREKIREETMTYDEIVEKKLEDTKKLMDEIAPEIKIDNKKMLKILNDMPAFVGDDEKKYGPFSKGDVVSLPENIMSLLVSRNIAENIMD